VAGSEDDCTAVRWLAPAIVVPEPRAQLRTRPGRRVDGVRRLVAGVRRDDAGDDVGLLWCYDEAAFLHLHQSVTA
jgi:hypothetical protein